VFPSGESLKATETGLVAKTRRKMKHLGESWEAVMRLAFLVAGDDRANLMSGSEMIWTDPESRTESEHVDAVLKMAAAGVPQQFIWERLGFSPPEIARMIAMRETEAASIQNAFDPLAAYRPEVMVHGREKNAVPGVTTPNIDASTDLPTNQMIKPNASKPAVNPTN
jgi:hypothetical protein